MGRGISWAVPGVALAAAGGLWAEARRAANAPLPHFGDLDASGRYGTPGAPPLRVAALGDSSLTGPGLSHPWQIWLARVLDGLERDVHLDSHARGGSRVGDVLVAQAPEAIEDPVDLFVVVVGANDAVHGTPAPSFGRRFGALLDLLEPVAPVLSFGVGDLSMVPRIPPRLRPVLAHRCRVIDRVHAEVARGRPGVLRVSVRDLSDPRFRAGGPTLYAADRFHPNEAGHAMWARLFQPVTRLALERVASRPQPSASSRWNQR